MKHPCPARWAVAAAAIAIVAILPAASAALDPAPKANAGPDKTVNAGEPTWLNGTGQDDGYIVKYEWDFDGDGIYEWNSVQSGNASRTYNSAGVFNATLRVTSNTNQLANDTARITVKAKNIEPLADAGPDLKCEVDTPLIFNGTGTDADGLIMRYEWDFENDDRWDYSGSTGTVAHQYFAPGDHIALLRVTDSAIPAGFDTDMCKVTAYPRNQRPAANAGNPVTATAGDPVVIVGKGSDPEDAVALYEWDLDGDGRWDWSSETTGTVTWRYWVAGTYAARLRVTDGSPIPASDISSVTVTVLQKNSPPVIVGPENLTAIAGRPVAMTVFAMDPDQGDLIQKYSWDFDGNGAQDRFSRDPKAAWTFNSSGTYVVKVTVFDGRNATASWKINVTAGEAEAQKNGLADMLPYIAFLLGGLGAGGGAAGLVTAWYMKKHWEKFFRPSKLESMQMNAELELEERSGSSFRGGPPTG
jgi:hypothetical protein